jgi:hypothetical protein
LARFQDGALQRSLHIGSRRPRRPRENFWIQLGKCEVDDEMPLVDILARVSGHN